MTDVETQLAYQMFKAGQLHGMVMGNDNPRELKSVSKIIDPDMLQGFLDKKPEALPFPEEVQQAVRLARTFKSLSKG